MCWIAVVLHGSRQPSLRVAGSASSPSRGCSRMKAAIWLCCGRVGSEVRLRPRNPGPSALPGVEARSSFRNRCPRAFGASHYCWHSMEGIYMAAAWGVEYTDEFGAWYEALAATVED